MKKLISFLLFLMIPVICQASFVTDKLTVTSNFITQDPIADVRGFEGGTISGTDNLAAINACFASSANTCRLTDGTWKISGTVVIPGSSSYSSMGKKLLLDTGAILLATGDFNIVQLSDKSQLEGGILSTVGVSPYTSSMIYVQGRTGGIESGTGADNVSLYGNNNNVVGTGDGIYLQADGANQYIEFAHFRNIRMFGVNHGIHLSASSAGGGNFVNGNIFENIIIDNPVYGIYVDGDQTNSNEAEGNLFTDIQMQMLSTSTAAIFCNSNYNVFYPFMFDLVGTTKSINFPSTSNNNFVYASPTMLAGGAGITDAGVNNNFSNKLAGKLTLQSTSGTSSLPINLQNTGNPAGNNASFGIESSTGGAIFSGTSPYAMVFGTSTTNSVQIATNNNVAITALSNGNIGIGSANPVTKLDIEGGAIKQVSSSLAANFIESTNFRQIQIDAANKKIHFGSTSVPDSDLILGSYNSNVNFQSGGSPINLSGANVGIGSATPGAQLDVNGTVRATGFTAPNGNVGVSNIATTTCGCKTYSGGLCTQLGTCS